MAQSNSTLPFSPRGPAPPALRKRPTSPAAKGTRAALCTLILGVIFTLGLAEGHAQECISQQARDALSTCSGIKPKAAASKPQIRFSGAPQKRTKRTRKDHIKPPNPNDAAKDAIRDARRVRMQPQVLKLLLTEIAGVERLYKSTPKGNPDRPRLMRRLAEGYVELESSAFRDKINAETKAQQFRRKAPKQAAKFKKVAKRSAKFIKTARKSAIKYYRQLKTQYPKWCQFPKNPPEKRGCTDEVLYYLAYEYEQAGKLDKAREAYLELTEQWKSSRFVPSAYLAFGELFFNEAQGDPSKWDYAANFYKEVLKYKAPENKLYGYAAYKLAYVHWNQGEYAKAIDLFKDVIELGNKHPQLANASGLADSARRDIIPVYALKGNPAKAYGFFHPLSGDKGVNNEKTFKMMEDLGQNLIDTGHYAEGITLYKDLMKRNRGEHLCFYQARISDAVMARKGGDKGPIVAELKNQLAVYQKFMKSRHSASAKLKCGNETASLITETAMAWHLEAVGSGGVRGTNDPATKRYSAQLYKMVVGNFTREQFAQFKFPRIVKEDWPTMSKVLFAMANLSYENKDWEACGPAFDAVVAENPKGLLAAEAAYAAVLCYHQIYLAKHKDGSHLQQSSAMSSAGSERVSSDASRFQPMSMGSDQKNMIGAFDRYICYIKPPEKDRAAIEQYVDVKYARARMYYELQRWEEAAWAFRDIAINHAETEAAVFAAQLYLHSLDVMETKLDPPKVACGKMMKRDVPTFLKSFCGASRGDNEDQCQVLSTIERNLVWRQAERMVNKCDKSKGSQCIKQYEKAGNLYYGLWKKYGEKACEAHTQDPKDDAAKVGCARNDEILYNAARAFQAARLIAKAIDIRRILINEKYGLTGSEHAKKAVYEIGGNYQAIAVYDLAANWYERFARDYPKMSQAPDALSDAVVLRLGLGDSDKAIADAKLFNRKYGRSKPAQSAQIAFAIGAHHAEHDNWLQAERSLSRAMRQIDASATIDVRIQAHAVLGRAYAKMKRRAQADREYAKVRDAWRDPAAAVKKAKAVGGDKAVQERRIGKMLMAVGEAHYYFGEKKRARVNKIRFPEYKGSGSRQDVEQFIRSKVKDWMDKKRAAIEDADKTYQSVLTLKPQPPPKWVIKSGAAVGAMWGRFVADFRSAPYPSEWDQPGTVPGTQPPLLWAELKAIYVNKLVVASKREMIAAKGAYKKCLDYSLRFQYFDEDSRACEEWLSKTYPNEYHLIDEFRGAPTQVNSGLDERPQALDIGGAPR